MATFPNPHHAVALEGYARTLTRNDGVDIAMPERQLAVDYSSRIRFMDRVQALTELTSILQEVIDDPAIVLTPATTAGDVEGWDSMTNITFVVAAERRFGVKFKTAEIEEMHNVGDMLTMIAAKGGKL